MLSSPPQRNLPTFVRRIVNLEVLIKIRANHYIISLDKQQIRNIVFVKVWKTTRQETRNRPKVNAEFLRTCGLTAQKVSNFIDFHCDCWRIVNSTKIVFKKEKMRKEEANTCCEKNRKEGKMCEEGKQEKKSMVHLFKKGGLYMI